jgi:hypothetical protein
MKTRHMEHIIKEATVIKLYPDDINRKEGLSLSKAWKSLLQTVKE